MNTITATWISDDSLRGFTLLDNGNLEEITRESIGSVWSPPSVVATPRLSGTIEPLRPFLGGDKAEPWVVAQAKSDAEALFGPPATPLDPSDLIKALAVIVLDPHNRTAIDPKALEQARAALGLSG